MAWDDRIRAQLTALKECYRVHVGCLGEVADNGFCYGCGGHVRPGSVVFPNLSTEQYIEDVGLLLLHIESRDHAGAYGTDE